MIDRVLRSNKLVCWAFIVAMIATTAAVVIRELHPIYSVATGVGVVCLVAYLFMSRKTKAERVRQNERRFLSGVAASLSLLVLGLVVYYLRPDTYVKPLPYYVLTAISTGALFIAAVHANTYRKFAVVIVLSACIGLTHVWTESLLFPGSLIGIDPWHHMNIVSQEIPNGSTEVPIDLTTLGGSYSLLHLYLRLVMNVFHIGYKMAVLMFAGSVLLVGNITLVGLIGKSLRGYSIGAIAAVIVSVANWNLFFAEWVIPNAVGVTLSLFVAYLILSKRETGRSTWAIRVPFIVLATVLAFLTHLIAAGWVMGTIACFTIPRLVKAVRGRRVRRRSAVAAVVLIVLIGSSIPVWLTTTTQGNSLARTAGQLDFNPSFGIRYSIGATPKIEADPKSPDAPITPLPPEPARELLSRNTLAELTFDSIGMLLYFGLAIVGTVILIKRKRANSRMWALLGLVVLAIGFFPPLFGKSLLEHRWWFFAEVLLAVPLALSLRLWARHYRLIMPVAFVCFVAFASTIGLPTNVNNRTLSPNLIVRYGMTDAEMDAVKVIAGKQPSSVGTDPLYYNVLVNNTAYPYPKKLAVSIADNLISGDFSGVKADFIVLRSSVYTEPLGFGGGTIYRIDPRIMDVIISYGYRETWSNKEVHILERRGNAGR